MSNVHDVSEQATTNTNENSRNPHARHSTRSVIYVLRVHKKVQGRDIVFESNATSHERMKGKIRGIKILYVIWILGPDLMI